jgi:hypothetical protein
MPLKLIEGQQELSWYPIYFHKETQKPWPVNEDNEPIAPDDNMEKAEFGLIQLSSGDITRITNQLYSTTRKGKSKFEYGTASTAKIMAACKRIKNIGNTKDAEQEIPFTLKIQAQLPPWTSEQLLDEINQRNNLMPEQEQD